MNRRYFFLSLGVAMIISITGCGSESTQKKCGHELNQTNLKKILEVYSFQEPPKDEAALKTELEKKNIPTSCLVSQRDNKPYIILYEKSVKEAKEYGGVAIIAWEQTGKDGTIFAATERRTVIAIPSDVFPTLPLFHK